MSTTPEAVHAELASYIGAQMAAPRTSLDGVNAVMIRHWCQALGDAKPRYAPGPEQVAPPAMLQAWCMREYDTVPSEGASAAIDSVLENAGYTAVVATNCEQQYARDLRPGDVPVERRTLEAVSDEKTTALGRGFFLTVTATYEVDGEPVATMRFRTLRYQPRVSPSQPDSPDERPAARRPRAAQNQDNEFFFAGAARGEQLVRRCAQCGRDQHPPLPMCPACGSLDWQERPAAQTGTVYTFTVTHHPQFPGFPSPLVVALVELDEPAGVRLVTNLIDIDPDEVRVGLPVEITFVNVDGGSASDGLVLPLCRPASRARVAEGSRS
jgi:uncharacterized OB-fold protein